MIRPLVLYSLIILFANNLWVTHSVSALFTGNTASYLEPCGCVEGMLGGIARRSAAIKDERDFILFDSGNFIDIAHKLDETRNLFYARSFQELGYEAVGISSKEATRSTSFLKALSGSDLFVATNIKSSARDSYPFKKEIKAQGYTIISLISASTDAHEDHKIIDPLKAIEDYLNKPNLILLSSLSTKELEAVVRKLKSRLSLVVANQSRGEFETMYAVPVIYPGEKGKMVKKYDFATKKYDSLAVLDSYEENPALKEIVDGFYKAVEEDSELQQGFDRFFETEPMENLVLEGKNKFVGSEACKNCHQEVYDQYQTTSHSHAFDILLQKKRDFVPACVKCHTVGFGYESGYQISLRQKHLQQVGCESCHGAGYNHVRNPSSTNIALKVPKSRCVQCHDPENSPYFQYAAFKPLVDHSQKAPKKEKSAPPEKQTTVVMDLYVMSECPFGVKAENKLLPLAKKYGERLDLNLRFIATDVEGKVAEMNQANAKKDETLKKAQDSSNPGCKADFELDPDAKFQSLHGKSEVEEDMRQVIISKLFPEQIFDYVLERNKNIYGDWRLAATKTGVTTTMVEEAMKDGRGDQWFRENIAKGNAEGISASPTLRINDAPFELPFDEFPLEYQICEAMQNPVAGCLEVPMCASDSHCVEEGKNGFCRKPGTKEAKCEFEDPIEIEMTMIIDEDCLLCESGSFLQNLHLLYPKLKVKTLSKNSTDARKILETIQADRFPLFVFDNTSFQKSPRTARLEKYLAAAGGIYFVNPLVNEVASLGGIPRLNSLKIYTNPFAQTSGMQKHVLDILQKVEEGKTAVDYQVVPMVSQVRADLSDPRVREEAFMVTYSDGKGKSMPIYLESRHGKKEILESVTQLCISRLASKVQYRDYLYHVSEVISGSLAKIQSQDELSKAVARLDMDSLRRDGLKKAGISDDLQQKIAQCVGGPEGGRELLMSLIDLSQRQVVAAPTMLINDYYLIRGVSPKLLESLPEILKSNQPTDKSVYGLSTSN